MDHVTAQEFTARIISIDGICQRLLYQPAWSIEVDRARGVICQIGGKSMRSLVLAVLVVLCGCEPSGLEPEPADADVMRHDAAPPPADAQGRTWTSSAEAVAAECGAWCAWYEKCQNADRAECFNQCELDICGPGGCQGPPAGGDDSINRCVDAAVIEATASFQCGKEVPYTYTDACVRAISPG